MTHTKYNVLGELTAESDVQMLASAFYESRPYHELVGGTDFRFVVGRRGTGKSALYQRIQAALMRNPSVFVLAEHPTEDKVLAFHGELERLTGEYINTRHVTRLTWKTQILLDAVDVILLNFKAARLEEYEYLSGFKQAHSNIYKHKGLARGLQALRTICQDKDVTVGQVPERLADHFDHANLSSSICSALRTLKKRIVFLYDGLDEGWLPTKVATGLIGGLAKAASEFRENSHQIHCLLFIRDNMFRALAQFDGDYTRNIEGSTLRLQWDEESLFQLVANRLRTSFGWTHEQPVRIWNRFAQRELQGREGFQRCLRLTLYRPRDLIALLNGAYQQAVSHGRDCIIEDDLDSTATSISKTRLSDLYKEYERVLPGLPVLAEVFRSRNAQMSYDTARTLLDGEIQSPQSGDAASDFALLSSASEAFNALYSVGFVGVKDEQSPSARFCHDGSNTAVDALAMQRTIVVHPCYWRALDIVSDDPHVETLLLRVDDEDDAVAKDGPKGRVQDLRLQRLGRVVGELGQIGLGHAGARSFEEWVLTTARYLFAGSLDNITRNPNGASTKRRDVVGTNRGKDGFWRRLERDYQVSQFIIECKNFEEMDQDVFRQVESYLVPPYGRCAMVVTRASTEKLTQKERSLVVDAWNSEPRKLVFLMPASLLQRALSKMRSGNEHRRDYIKDLLAKRLDTFERSYVSQRSGR